MRDEMLKSFNLAGGPALALYMGHRLSIDLDLFTPEPFDAPKMEKYLTEKYHFKGDYVEKDTLKGSINGVKIDCITHNYPFVEKPLITKEGIRLYSIKDIAAMKLSAIADNGTRLKDFIDIACLSTKLSLSDMLTSYQAKYPASNPMRPIKGLDYYDDVNFAEPIQMLNGAYKWNRIERRINSMLKSNTSVFADLPIEVEKKSNSINASMFR